MPYRSLRFDTDAAAADAWSDALLEAGALSVDVSDPHAGTAVESPIYGEPGEPAPAAWSLSRLTALFANDADADAAIADAERAVGTPLPPHERGEVAEQDWVRATQAQFAPIHVAGPLWIVPTWCEAPAPDALNLRLDPGLAFGTGSHPTTRLCLEWLVEQRPNGLSLLDYGCGSGVLAIAAARLGARPVVGTDIDPQAIRASTDNARANGVDATFTLPDALRAGAFDVVVANILSNPLIVLAPALAGRVRAGGRIALSGILEPQADEVAAAYAPWFNIRPRRSAEGWVLLIGERAA